MPWTAVDTARCWQCSSHCCLTKHFPGKFQTVDQIHEERGDPGDICIDQGFTFTHTRVPSQAVIQGLFGLASNSRSAVSWVQTDVPRTAFLMKVSGPTRLPDFLNSYTRDFTTASTPPPVGLFISKHHNFLRERAKEYVGLHGEICPASRLGDLFVTAALQA